MQKTLLASAIEANEIPLTEKLVVVHLDFRQWTGTTVFKESDFQIGDNGRLPPKAIIRELGSKNIIDPKELERFNTIKQRARSLLEQNGVSFMGGWGIPLDRAETILKELKVHADEYESAKAEFLKNYDKKVEEWIAQNPDFAPQLRSAVKSALEVDTRIYARFTAVRIAPVGDNDGLNAEVGSLAERLLKSVAQTANRLLVESLTGKQDSGVTQRPVGTLRKMREKLIGLQFLDNGISPLINMIDETIRRIPKSGKIMGQAFWLMQGCVSILSDIDRMKAIANGALTLDGWAAHLSPVPSEETFELTDSTKEKVPVTMPETNLVSSLSEATDPATILANLKQRFEESSELSLFPMQEESVIATTSEAPTLDQSNIQSANVIESQTYVSELNDIPVPPAPPEVDLNDGLFF